MPAYMTAKGGARLEQRLLNNVRDAFDGAGEVGAHALVFSRNDPKTGDQLEGTRFAAAFMPAQFTDPSASKEKFARVLRLTCRSLDAFAVAFVSESWLATGETAHQQVLSGESLEKLKGRNEVVMVTMEHCAFKGPRCWTAGIEREGGTVRLLDWEELEGQSGGRFANLLPGSGGN